ncbi:MAG: hypothetical protein MUE71_12040 [Chitinophagaceae bacterium]|nr:hypothetical protein [Chitinophagaceae bacterium]
MKKLLPSLLFSNSFYGLAAVLLAIESNLIAGRGLNSVWLYIILFAGTVIFYSFSYNYDPHPLPGNQRAQWIRKNKIPFLRFQYFLMLSCMVSGIFYWIQLPSLPAYRYIWLGFLLVIFPLLGILYYGLSFPGLFRVRLRTFGWIKPFVIGAVWAGCVTFMPRLMYQWERNAFEIPGSTFLFLWIHNWMFISVLAIMFDIKDYAADHNKALKTFVVRVGLRKVLYSIIIPLSLIGFSSLWLVLEIRQTSIIAIGLLLFPVLLIIWVALNMHKKRSVGWYLLVIDGLMPVKAVCGMLAAYWL